MRQILDENIGNFAYIKISELALNDYWTNPYNGIINSDTYMNISPFLCISHPCDKALQWTNKQLLNAGLRPVQTFDLHAARVGLHGCPCPNHGTNECDCQMVVMLVYGQAKEPVTLILHGNDGRTWFSIADGQRRADVGLINAIQQALEVKAPESNTP